MKKMFPVFPQFPRYLLKMEVYQFRSLSRVSKDTYEDPAEFTWKRYLESEGPPPCWEAGVGTLHRLHPPSDISSCHRAPQGTPGLSVEFSGTLSGIKSNKIQITSYTKACQGHRGQRPLSRSVYLPCVKNSSMVPPAPPPAGHSYSADQIPSEYAFPSTP